MGDIVNLSARLMVAAQTYILADQDTFDSCRNAKTLAFKRLDDIRVKGKANPIAVYQPTKRRSTGDRKRSGTTYTSTNRYFNTLIGREEEMKVLCKCNSFIHEILTLFR